MIEMERNLSEPGAGATSPAKAPVRRPRPLATMRLPRCIRSALGGAGRGNAGTAAVEFALSAPVLLGLLVPVADLGIAFSQRHQLEQAVQAGAQYAAFHPWNRNSPTDIAKAVTAASTLSGVSVTPAPYQVCGCPTGGGVATASCTGTCPSGDAAGYYVVVNAQLPYTPVLPYSALGDSTVLTAQSMVRIR